MPVRTSYYPCPGPFLLLACDYEGNTLLNEVLNVSLLACRQSSVSRAWPGFAHLCLMYTLANHMSIHTERHTHTHIQRYQYTHRHNALASIHRHTVTHIDTVTHTVCSYLQCTYTLKLSAIPGRAKPPDICPCCSHSLECISGPHSA